MDRLSDIVTQGNRQGAYFFGILGGEPLLQADLPALFARHPKSYFLLFTNGTLITRELAAELRRLGNVSPLVSVEGSETVSDERRGGSEVHARTMAGLAYCRENRLITGVATSVCRSNLRDLACEAFVRELIDRGVHYLWYYIYRPVGPRPTPELALSAEQIRELRRFLVDIRTRVPMAVIDAYWDEDGRAICPAALGIGYHISPEGDVEPCPPIQFACDRVGDGQPLDDVLTGSEFLAGFRELAGGTTRGCVLLERPDLLREYVIRMGARDTSGRGTALDELQCMCTRSSHDMGDEAIPERSAFYRFAKKRAFFGFGAYG